MNWLTTIHDICTHLLTVHIIMVSSAILVVMLVKRLLTLGSITRALGHVFYCGNNGHPTIQQQTTNFIGTLMRLPKEEMIYD